MWTNDLINSVFYIIFPGGSGGHFIESLITSFYLGNGKIVKPDNENNEYVIINHGFIHPQHPEQYIEVGDGSNPERKELYIPTVKRYKDSLNHLRNRKVLVIDPGKYHYFVGDLCDIKNGLRFGRELRKQRSENLKQKNKEQRHIEFMISQLRRYGADLHVIDYERFFISDVEKSVIDLFTFLSNGLPPWLHKEFFINRISMYHKLNLKLLEKHNYNVRIINTIND